MSCANLTLTDLDTCQIEKNQIHAEGPEWFGAAKQWNAVTQNVACDAADMRREECTE